MTITVQTFDGHSIASSDYEARLFAADLPSARETTPTMVHPLHGAPRLGRSAVKEMTLPLHISIKTASLATRQDELAQWFNPSPASNQRTRVLTVSWEGVSRSLDCHVVRIVPYDGSPTEFTAVLQVSDPYWRSTARDLTTTSITTSPKTFTVANAGTAVEPGPRFYLQPYVKKANSNRYGREIIVANRVGREFTNYALDLTNGGYDHASDVTAGRSLASGNDVHVYVDHAAVPRWASSDLVYATGTLTNDGSNVSNGDTVVVGSKTFTFQTTLTNVDGHVHIGGSNTASMTNLFHAINASGGTPGTDYAAATVAHTQVTATNPTGTTVVVTAITGGTTGNAIASTETSTHLSWGGSTLSGGSGHGFNNSTTRIWVNLDLAPARTFTLLNAVTSTSPLNGEDLEVTFGDTDGWPYSGYFVLDAEVFGYYGTTRSNANNHEAFQNVVRAARGTVAASHAASATGYWIEKRIQVVNGDLTASAPDARAELQPLIDLSSATTTNQNLNWSLTSGFAHETQGRSMGWTRRYDSELDSLAAQILEPLSGLATELKTRYNTGGALAGYPAFNLWEREFPSGLNGSLSLSRTIAATFGLRVFGQDSDGNLVSAAVYSGIPSTVSFSYTGSTQSWTVPAGVTSITVDLGGAGGGSLGYGGRTRATVAVSPGDVFQIRVGGAGVGTAGGYNGGGNGAANGYGGGGATDIRNNSPTFGNSDRVAIAAGGGSSANANTDGANGTDGDPTNAHGGTGGAKGATGAGGAHGTGGTGLTANGSNGTDGSIAQGGDGGAGGNYGGYNGYGGGGGGGGKYGGGGGGGGGLWVTSDGDDNTYVFFGLGGSGAGGFSAADGAGANTVTNASFSNAFTLPTQNGSATITYSSAVSTPVVTGLYGLSLLSFCQFLGMRPASSAADTTGNLLTTSQTATGQQFTTGSSQMTLASAILRVAADTTGRTLTVAVYSDNGSDAPSTQLPNGTATLTSLGSSPQDGVFIFSTPLTLQPDTKYWLTLKQDAGTCYWYSNAGSYTGGKFRVASADSTGTVFDFKLIGYPPLPTSAMSRFDGNVIGTDGDLVDVTALTVPLDPSGVPYVAMVSTPTMYPLSATIRNLTTGQALALSVPVSLTSLLEVDVGRRSVMNLAEGPFWLNYTGTESTDLQRALDNSAAPDSSMGIWESTTNMVIEPLPVATTDYNAYVGTETLTLQSSGGRYSTGSFLRCVTPGGVTQEGVDFEGVMSLTAGQPYTFGVDLKGSGTVKISIVDSLGVFTTSSVITLTSTWTRYYVSVASLAHTGLAFVNVLTNGAQVATIDACGWQVEHRAFGSPYVDGSLGTGYAWTGTANASTSTRAASRVQMPTHDLFTGETGWFAATVRMHGTNSNATSTNPTVFRWTDGTYYLDLTYDRTNTRWSVRRYGVSSDEAHTATATYSDLSIHTIVCYWTTGFIAVSIDGGAFVSGLSPLSVLDLSAIKQLDLGQVSGTSTYLNADFLWVATGAGVLADADAVVLNGYGSSDPGFEQLQRELNSGALPTAIWWGDSYNFKRVNLPSGSRLSGTITPTDPDEWLRLDPGTNALSYDETGAVGVALRTVTYDRWV